MENIESEKVKQLNSALNEQNYMLANSILKELCNISPNTYQYQLNLAATYRKINEPQKSYKTYEIAKKLNNKDPILYFNLANLLHEDLNRIDESIENFLISLSLNPNEIECWKNLSILYMRTDQYDLAIKASDKILSMDALHFDGNAIKGYCLMSLGHIVKAKPFIEKALEIQYDERVMKCLSAINHSLGKVNEGIIQGIKSDGAFVFYSDDRPYKII
ncbi:MAG: hypothetical protein VYE11_01810 [Pseudomonadota bacterium]|nr:hypothetical protein [Pseudomonadota bacterium]